MKKTAAQLVNHVLAKIARNVDPERAAQSGNNAPARSPKYYGENPGAAVHSEQNLTARQRGQNLYPTPPTQPQQNAAQRIIAAGGASGRGYTSRLT